MVLYGFYLLAFLLLHLLAKDKYSIKKQCIGCFILLFVFYGLRDIPILNDTAHYYEHFSYLISSSSFDHQKIWEFDLYDRFGVGYLIFENIVGKIWRNPYAIIMSSACIITISWIFLVKKHVREVAMCFFLILVFGIMNSHYSGIRQGLAVCVFFYSYLLFLTKDKINYYYAGCFLALSFHSSAIVLFAVPLLKKIQINKKTIFLAVVATMTVSLSLNYIFEITGLNETSKYFAEAQERTTLPIANLIILFFFTSMMLLSKDASVNRTKESEILWWFSILNIVFRFLALFIGIIGRYTMYFAVFTIILFVNSIAYERKISSKKLLLILVAFIYVFVTLIYRPEWTHIIPYSFYDFSSNYHDLDLGY